MKIKNKIKFLLDDKNISSYYIGNKTNTIGQSMFTMLRNGKRKVGSIKLDNALKLAKLYDKLNKENKI